MRWKWGLVIAVLALLCTRTVRAQVQAVQGSNGQSGATKTVATAQPLQIAQGDMVYAQVASTCTVAPKVTDLLGNTYTLDVNKAGQQGVAAFHAVSLAAGTSPLTATFATLCNYAAVFAEKVVGGTGTLDGAPQTATTAALTGTQFNIGTLTTTQAGDFLIAVVTDNLGIGGLGAPAGWALLPAVNSPGAAEYKTNSTAGALAVSMNIATSGYRMTGVALAYKTGAIQPPPAVQQLPMQLTLRYATPNNGTPVNGSLTLYTVTKNPDGTYTLDGVANWTVVNGAVTAWIPVTQQQTTYEFALANGQVNTPQFLFTPSVYYPFLENLVMASPPVTVQGVVTINLTTGAATADPGSVTW